jgi:ATP-dependent Clp protease protease subunit
MDMAEEKKNRELILGEDVEEAIVKELIRQIREINKFDNEQEEEKKEYKREPINLLVNTNGGTVYDGFALVAAMDISKTPIHTICLGKAMSMGFIVFAAGHKRFAHPFATFMYHQIRGYAGGELIKIQRTAEEWERLEKIYDTYILKKTNLLQEKLDDVKEKCKNWYIPAEEAKKYGLVDVLL